MELEFPIIIAERFCWVYWFVYNEGDIKSLGFEKIDVDNQEYLEWSFSGIPLEVYWDIKTRSARLKKADNPDDYPQLYDFLRQYAVDFKVEIGDEQDIEKIV